MFPRPKNLSLVFPNSWVWHPWWYRGESYQFISLYPTRRWEFKKLLLLVLCITPNECFIAVVPNLFGPRDQFHERQFFYVGGRGFWMIEVHYIQVHLPLCGPVPNRPRLVPVLGPEIGDPCFTAVLFRAQNFMKSVSVHHFNVMPSNRSYQYCTAVARIYNSM